MKSKIFKDPSKFKDRATYQQGSICGFVDIIWRNATSLPGVRLGSNCEFPGSGVREESSLPEECGRLCVKNPCCNHFSWKKIEGVTFKKIFLNNSAMYLTISSKKVGTCTMKHGSPTMKSAKYRLKASCGIVDMVKAMNKSRNGLDDSSTNRTELVQSVPIFYGIFKFFEKHVFGSEWLGIETRH